MKALPVVVMTFAMSTFALAADRPAPVRITQGPVVEGVGDNWAVIAWTTNTGGSSVVRYGFDRRNLSQTSEAPYSDNDKTAAQNHRVRLNGLKAGATYYFVAVSSQGEGTGTKTASEIGQFSTKSENQGGGGERRAEALRITDGPRVEDTGSTWAEIVWTTNTGGSTIVRYGTHQDHLTQMAEAPYADNDRTKAQTHRVRLTNLKQHSMYYFMVDSGQGEGTGTEAKSSVGQFMTKGR